MVVQPFMFSLLNMHQNVYSLYGNIIYFIIDDAMHDMFDSDIQLQ